MKGLKLFLTAGVFTVLGLTGVNAADSTKITTVDELNACIKANGTCVLQNDLTTDEVIVNGEGVKTVIDLNGKTLYSWITVSEKGELTVKDSGSNGSITKHSTVKVLTDGKFILDGGTIDASDKGNGIWVENATFIMNGGKVKAKEFGVTYKNKSKITINNGTIETKDNIAIGDNGTAGWGGNVVNVNGGNLISNIVSAGYISCGIYNSNDTTLTVKSGVKITANNGGAGIVIRGGKVTIAKDVIDNMVTGTSKGTVGDSKVIVAGKVVKDYASNYPAKDTINVTIDYATVVNKEVANSIESKQQTALNNEISSIVNGNKIPELNNTDLTNIAIKTTVDELSDTQRDQVAQEAKEVVKDFKPAKALDLGVVVTNNGNRVSNLSETTNKIPFAIDVKSITTDSKLNYEFQVIRYHVNSSQIGSFDVLESTYDAKNGVVSFETDKFSIYLLSYKTSVKSDNNTANPQTGDGIAYTALGLLLSALAIAGITYKLKNN